MATAVLQTEMPVYALVEKALGGACMIALACDKIYMVPDGSMGDSQPIVFGSVDPQIVTSNAVEVITRIARATGRDPHIARCMVDPSQELVVGQSTLCKKGDILILDSETACRLSISESTVASVDALLERMQEQETGANNTSDGIRQPAAGSPKPSR
jgi:membrane-bound serine protease (ClpP class)